MGGLWHYALGNRFIISFFHWYLIESNRSILSLVDSWLKNPWSNITSSHHRVDPRLFTGGGKEDGHRSKALEEAPVAESKYWMDLENMDANIYIYIERYILWHGNIEISILWLWDVMTCLVILGFCHKISHHLWWRRPVRSLVAERNCAFGLSFWSHILFLTILELIYIFSHQST